MRNNFYKTAFIFSSISIFALLISACGGGSKVESEANANKEKPAPVAVNTTPAVVRDIPTYFEATGNLASDAQTDVAPTVGGKITAVNFDLGSYVNRGDILVRLDDRDAKIKVEQTQAQVEQAQAQVKQAQANVEQSIENLRQTQARLGVRDGEVFKIEDFSQVKSITAQLVLAEQELTRATRLIETGDIARAVYDQKKSERDRLIGQLDEARSNAAVAIKAIDVARAQVATTRTNVGNAQAGVEAAQTQVASAQKAVGDAVIYAPISGYISERNADLGEFVSTTQKVATVVRTAVLRLQIEVPEQSIGKVAAGQGISAQVTAYPDRTFAGTVVRTSPSVNATSRTLVVEAEIENAGGLLKPGQFATVRITQPKPEPAVLIPTLAVRADGEINKVFVIKEGVAQERVVQLGLLENDMIQIKQGVAENELVATNNTDKLGDGVIVNQ